MSASAAPDTIFDAVIVGAGISGINAAYRFQTEIKGGTNYIILESRGAIGGTWDLFRYPGFRSDSSMYTFGFEWRPWKEEKSISDGGAILKYIQDSAAATGIAEKVKYYHKLVGANWSDDQQLWRLTVDAGGETKYFHTRFLCLGTGYYDYKEALSATIPGLADFKGKVIHPQFWPEDLDYENQKIIIVGSGATAVTLLPNLIKQASHVTMLQRSPSYILSQPSIDPLQQWLSRKVPSWPKWLTHRIVRYKNLIISFLAFKFCQAFPNQARSRAKKGTLEQLPPSIPFEPHFTPRYNIWEQRLCICPDGDFYQALRTGKGDIVTGTIKSVTPTGIQVSTPQGLEEFIEADIIITATGLKLRTDGGAQFSINGQATTLSSKYLWNGSLIQDFPNFAFMFGYSNASWTLGADATSLHVCRILNYMKKKGFTSVVPRVEKGMKERKLLNLSATYVEIGKGDLPKCGDRGPWRPRTAYFGDLWEACWGSFRELEFVKKSV